MASSHFPTRTRKRKSAAVIDSRALLSIPSVHPLRKVRELPTGPCKLLRMPMPEAELLQVKTADEMTDEELIRDRLALIRNSWRMIEEYWIADIESRLNAKYPKPGA